MKDHRFKMHSRGLVVENLEFRLAGGMDILCLPGTVWEQETGITHTLAEPATLTLSSGITELNCLVGLTTDGANLSLWAPTWGLTENRPSPTQRFLFALAWFKIPALILDLMALEIVRRNVVKEETMQFPWQKKESHAATWKTVGSFLFEGSDTVGIPQSVRAVSGTITASQVDVRLMDVDNNKTIAAKLLATQTYPSTIPLSAPTNLPANAALFELQIRRPVTSTPGKVAASILVMDF